MTTIAYKDFDEQVLADSRAIAAQIFSLPARKGQAAKSLRKCKVPPPLLEDCPAVILCWDDGPLGKSNPFAVIRQALYVYVYSFEAECWGIIREYQSAIDRTKIKKMRCVWGKPGLYRGRLEINHFKRLPGLLEHVASFGLFYGINLKKTHTALTSRFVACLGGLEIRYGKDESPDFNDVIHHIRGNTQYDACGWTERMKQREHEREHRQTPIDHPAFSCWNPLGARFFTSEMVEEPSPESAPDLSKVDLVEPPSRTNIQIGLLWVQTEAGWAWLNPEIAVNMDRAARKQILRGDSTEEREREWLMKFRPKVSRVWTPAGALPAHKVGAVPLELLTNEEAARRGAYEDAQEESEAEKEARYARLMARALEESKTNAGGTHGREDAETANQGAGISRVERPSSPQPLGKIVWLRVEPEVTEPARSPLQISPRDLARARAAARGGILPHRESVNTLIETLLGHRVGAGLGSIAPRAALLPRSPPCDRIGNTA